MQHVVRVVLLPGDHHTIIPHAIRDKRRKSWRHRFEVAQNAAPRFRPHHRVSVSLEHQCLDNPVDKRRAGHVVVRADVHLAAQLVFDPDVTGLRVSIRWMVILAISRAIVSTAVQISGFCARLT